MYQLNKHTNLESKLLADTAHEIRAPLETMRKEHMLMLYRIESGNYNPRLVPIELLTELENIVRPYKKRSETEIEISGREVTVVSNRSVVNLIVTRLLNNAIRHAAGAMISVNWDVSSEGVELHVDDAGKGVPEADRERIFDRHYRFQDKQSATSGTGLGLVLVRLYANTVNAKTYCTDSPLGGARFTVLFPATTEKQTKLPTTTNTAGKNIETEDAIT